MADNNTIRANARAQLGGNIFANNWLMMLVVGVIYGAITGFASSLIPGAALIIGGPLSYGIARVSINRACGNEKIEVMDLFKGFTDNFVGSLILGIMQSLFIVLWSLLFIIPVSLRVIPTLWHSTSSRTILPRIGEPVLMKAPR